MSLLKAVESVFDPVTLAAVERAYEKWLDHVTQQELFLQEASRRKTLDSLIQAMERVQALKLDRVELRACDIGRYPSSMSKVKQLFGRKKLRAPTVGTFFLKGVPVVTLRAFSQRYMLSTGWAISGLRVPLEEGSRIRRTSCWM